MPDQTAPQDPRTEFINVSVWHGSLDRAQEILAAPGRRHVELARLDVDHRLLDGVGLGLEILR